MADFNLPFGVRVSNNQPVDADRYLADNESQMFALVTNGRAKKGQQCYRNDNDTLYILQGATNVDWIPIDTSGSLFVPSLAKFNSLITTATPGNWKIIGSFSLDASKILPAGVTLVPDGGVIDLNGFTLTGTDSGITADLVQIFNTNLGVIDGTWLVEKAYPQWFGVAKDLVTDDALAFQKAINLLMLAEDSGAIGGELFIPAGYYGIRTPITTYPQVNITGNGSSNTFLASYMTSIDTVLTMDGTGVGTNAKTAWKGFSATSQVTDGGGFLLLNCAFCIFEDIYTEQFLLHWRLIGCLSSQFTNVQARFGPAGSVGMWAEKGIGSSNPNAITLNSCVFGSLAGYGIRLDDPSCFNMYGGSVEFCGSGILAGVLINNGGGQGAAAWNFNGVYFEGNIGVGDISVLINGATWESSGIVTGCTFTRLSATDFTVHNILLQTTSPADGFCNILVTANGFASGPAYTPNAARQYINVSAVSPFRITEIANMFEDEIELPSTIHPVIPYSSSIDIDLRTFEDIASFDIIPDDGVDFNINAPSYPKIGKILIITIINNFGVIGDALFNAGAGGFRLMGGAWEQPANGFSRSIVFEYSSTGLWVETSRTVPNGSVIENVDSVALNGLIAEPDLTPGTTVGSIVGRDAFGNSEFNTIKTILGIDSEVAVADTYPVVMRHPDGRSIFVSKTRFITDFLTQLLLPAATQVLYDADVTGKIVPTKENITAALAALRAFTQKSAAYTILSTDYIIEATANTFTLTLPTAVGIAGKEFKIKNSGAGVITIDGNGAETIDGDLTKTLTQYEALTIASNGTNYIIL